MKPDYTKDKSSTIKTGWTGQGQPTQNKSTGTGGVGGHQQKAPSTGAGSADTPRDTFNKQGSRDTKQGSRDTLNKPGGKTDKK